MRTNTIIVSPVMLRSMQWIRRQVRDFTQGSKSLLHAGTLQLVLQATHSGGHREIFFEEPYQSRNKEFDLYWRGIMESNEYTGVSADPDIGRGRGYGHACFTGFLNAQHARDFAGRTGSA